MSAWIGSCQEQGVDPPTHRATYSALGHASIGMALQTCTDSKLLDVSGALSVLPDLSLAPSAVSYA